MKLYKWERASGAGVGDGILIINNYCFLALQRDILAVTKDLILTTSHNICYAN